MGSSAEDTGGGADDKDMGSPAEGTGDGPAGEGTSTNAIYPSIEDMLASVRHKKTVEQMQQRP